MLEVLLLLAVAVLAVAMYWAQAGTPCKKEGACVPSLKALGLEDKEKTSTAAAAERKS